MNSGKQIATLATQQEIENRLSITLLSLILIKYPPLLVFN